MASFLYTTTAAAAVRDITSRRVVRAVGGKKVMQIGVRVIFGAVYRETIALWPRVLSVVIWVAAVSRRIRRVPIHSDHIIRLSWVRVGTSYDVPCIDLV